MKPQEAFGRDLRASGMRRQECRIARGTALGASGAAIYAAIPRRPDKKHRDFLGMAGGGGVPVRLRSLHRRRSGRRNARLFCEEAEVGTKSKNAGEQEGEKD